jgi:hypothetical protein
MSFKDFEFRLSKFIFCVTNLAIIPKSKRKMASSEMFRIESHLMTAGKGELMRVKKIRGGDKNTIYEMEKTSKRFRKDVVTQFEVRKMTKQKNKKFHLFAILDLEIFARSTINRAVNVRFRISS